MTIDEATGYVLARAQERGVAAEVLGEQSRKFSARAWHGRLDQSTQARQGGIGVRVVVEGRVGHAYCEELAPAALDWMLTEAVDNAALQQDATGFLPVGKDVGRHDLLGNGLAASLEAKTQTALGFEATMREDRRVKEVFSATYTEVEREVTLRSSTGAVGSYRRGVAGIVGGVVMQEGTSRKQGWESDWVTELQALDPGRTALKVTEGTGRHLGARPLQTGRYRAYFEPKAFTDLLGAFWPMWSGKMVVEGKSPFRGRMGEACAAALVTVVDDPGLPGGLARRPFDVEGTTGHRVALIDRGVLSGFLTNSETARALGLENTGHAARSYRSILGVAPSNCYISTGEGIAMHQGVLVTELMGIHAGTNPLNGDFSVQAFGLWMVDGVSAYPVEDFTVAGNFLTLLLTITGIGTSLIWNYANGSAFGSPVVEVAELSFAGT